MSLASRRRVLTGRVLTVRCRSDSVEDRSVLAPFCQGGEGDDVPVFAAFFGCFSEEATGKVVLVPAGLDQDDRGIWLKTCIKIVIEPVPDSLSIGLALSLGPALYRVIDYHKICSKACYSSADTDRSDSSAKTGFPL